MTIFRENRGARLESTTASVQAERDMLIGILETLSQSRHINEYLEQLVQHVRNYSGCRCIGIRLLDDEGNIPYTSYTGFSRNFYESESPLSINSDKCMCINVIIGNTDPGLSFYTDGGSFLSNGTTKLLASTPEETKGSTRNVCNLYGYESVALVPMRHKDRILGLIHVADESENKIPIERVRVLEQVGAHIGEALHTFVVKQEREQLLAQVLRERQRTEELIKAVEKEKGTLEIIIEYTDAHLAYLDSDFKFVWVNSTYAKGSGHAINELIGRNHFDLFPNEENQAIFEMVRDTGKSVEFHDKPFEYKDQPWRGVTYWDWTLTPIKDSSGGVQGLVLSLVDTTERKKLDQLKDEFLGLVSHELRSPLTVIIGAINTALSEQTRLSQEEMHQLLQDAALEADSLSHLLGNLLELSRAQADRLVLHVEPISVKNVTQDVVERIRRQSSAHRFVIDFPKGLPLVHADQLRVERILYNLLENAAKYSPPGSEIRVFAKREKDRLVIGITDQGVGISRENQAKLFGPFQRLEDSRLEGVKGAGLGLLVCRRLVEAHGGRIWVESEPDRGSTFFFTVALRERVKEQDIP